MIKWLWKLFDIVIWYCYLILLFDYLGWGSQQEHLVFAELHGVNIEVYDRVTSSNPMYHISYGLITTQTIRLFYSGNHYNSLFPRNTGDT